MGDSHRMRILVVSFTDRDEKIRIISARVANRRERKNYEEATKAESVTYDFSKGVRGKYAARYAEGTNVVVLAPDVAAEFPDADSVNKALRGLIKMRRPRSSKANS